MSTLIILHGWQSSREKWQKVKELIEGPKIQIIVPDLPGFKPENQPPKPWNLDDYLIWFEEFCSQADIKQPFYLLGHSFGGRIAIKFAAKYPERIKGLILVSAAGIKQNKTIKDNILLAIIRLARKLGVQETTWGKGMIRILRGIFYRYVLHRTDYLKANPIQKEIMKNALEEDLKPLLDKIISPTLIIWGKKDKTTPLKDGYLMNEKIKNSQIEVMDNIGHTPHLENPELSAKKIKIFINQKLS